jgi:hypothetical protein
MNEKIIIHYINQIPEPNRATCLKMMSDHADRFTAAPGSRHKHQAWPGGYYGHLAETMKIADHVYTGMSQIRPLPFTLQDAVLVLFLHDLEKPFKYIKPINDFHSEALKIAFVKEMIKRYGIVLSHEQQNALKYIHGEGSEHNSTTRVQGPLAAFVHSCDTMSARIWYDHPEH